MDPIGIAGILIVFAQVSSRIIVSCYEYQKSVKDAPDEVSRMHDEAAGIRNVAERLVDMVVAIPPLYCTAWYGLENATERLLATGASPEESCGIYGNALKAAAHNGHLAIVKLFIATNVDVNAIGGRYSTAVATAAAQDHVEIMRELLTAGANIKLQGRSDWRSGDCRTDPLFVAALNGSAEAVKVALEHGAVDYWRLKPCSGSALTAATDAGNQAVVQELLRHRDV
ncbi:Cortactin-binding protein 2 like [Verticillium longisporum]|nr:Cortactin-binding protein 2 like [Verticillium longisporum]